MYPQLDGSRLQLSGEGYIDDAHWAFFEGHHPIAMDDSALGQRLVVEWPDGCVSEAESVNQALNHAASLGVLTIVREHDDRGGGPGAVVVTFNAAASAVELVWSDGSTTSELGLASSVAGHRFIVSSLRIGESHVNVRLVDGGGATIVEQTVTL